MARQYEIPLTALYPISVQSPVLPPTQGISSKEDSEESEAETYAHHNIPTSTGSAGELTNTHPLNSTTEVAGQPVPTQGPELPRRSTRKRELPIWIRSGDYAT